MNQSETSHPVYDLFILGHLLPALVDLAQYRLFYTGCSAKIVAQCLQLWSLESNNTFKDRLIATNLIVKANGQTLIHLGNESERRLHPSLSESKDDKRFVSFEKKQCQHLQHIISNITRISITMPPNAGETYQERTKGKDVRTSNIVAAKVSLWRAASNCPTFPTFV